MPSVDVLASATSGTRDLAGAVRLDRRFGLRVIILMLLLTWPLMLYRQPAYFSDSVSYYKGGRAAVAFVTRKLQSSHVDRQAPTAESGARAPKPNAPGPVQNVPKSGRSIPYSVASYVLRWPGATMGLLTIFQAFLAAIVIAAVIGALKARDDREFLGTAAALAVLTPVAIVSCYVMPDIFAGLLVAVLALVAVVPDRLSLSTRLVLILIAAFAVAAHASHPPLALGVMALGAAWLLWRRRVGQGRFRSLCWLFMPFLLGSLATLLTGLVGFGEVSMSAGRFPLTLARSIDNGPGKWYLDRTCPTRRYAVCEVFDNRVPATVTTFLWAPTGLSARASPGQMRRIRAEEAEIVARAALAYPWVQIRTLAVDIPRQMLSFGLRAFRFDRAIALDPAGEPHLLGLDRTQIARQIVDYLSFATVIALTMVALLRFRSLSIDQKGFLAIVAGGLLCNAIICAAFSGVSGRYEARLIWLYWLAIWLIVDPRRIWEDRRTRTNQRGTERKPPAVRRAR